MKKHSMTSLVHLYLDHIVSKDDICIDATCGRGHDTKYLSSICKHVYAFDIQNEAIQSTKQLLDAQSIDNVDLIHDSHEHFYRYVKHFKGAIFNLGYLPHGDKTITTEHHTTIKTIKHMLDCLAADGFVMLVIYPGHPKGFIESREISSFISSINHKQYKIIKTYLPYQDNHPPYIIWITKL